MRRTIKEESKVKSSKLKNLLLLVLVAIAIILALAISKQRSKTTSPPSPSLAQRRLIPINLTEEERFILHPPAQDASRSAKDQHAQTVAKLAKQTDSLEINDCQPTPLVLQVKQGSNLKINNNNNITHKIIIDEEHSYQLPAKNSLDIKVDFKYGTGDYGYICEGVGLVGFLHVIP